MSIEVPDPSIGKSVSIRESVLARIEARAKKEQRSVSWLLNHAAECYMEENPDPDTDAEALRLLEEDRRSRFPK